jgi:hypothetical protein
MTTKPTVKKMLQGILPKKMKIKIPMKKMVTIKTKENSRQIEAFNTSFL